MCSPAEPPSPSEPVLSLDNVGADATSGGRQPGRRERNRRGHAFRRGWCARTRRAASVGGAGVARHDAAGVILRLRCITRPMSAAGFPLEQGLSDEDHRPEMRGHRQKPGDPHRDRCGHRGFAQVETFKPYLKPYSLPLREAWSGRTDQCRTGDAAHPPARRIQTMGIRGQRDRDGAVGLGRKGRRGAGLQAAGRQGARADADLQWLVARAADRLHAGTLCGRLPACWA